jgi:hypothetical protein
VLGLTTLLSAPALAQRQMEPARSSKPWTTASATYHFHGDEQYVRARVIESNGRRAWCQPVLVN